MNTSKNYSDGPDKNIIGGELAVEDGGVVTVKSGGIIVIEPGGTLFFGETAFDPTDAAFAPAAAQADSVAKTVVGTVADFNALLAKLRTAGLLESE